MADKHESQSQLDDLYKDSQHYHVNTGDETIHAKRIPGRFRRLKWMTMSLWSIFFIAPYLRWNDHQAILFDIPDRKFYLFGATIWPQDIWLLSLLLILLAMTLFGVTAVAGRVFCGYFCFQTVWTDVFTWIEDKIEGNPIKRRKLDQAPWTLDKIRKKVLKHSLWLIIAVATGVTFSAYFADVYELWLSYITLTAPFVAWLVLGLFIAGTYVLAGLMREQVCFWLCPYARIQSVMVDKDSILPTYDYHRGEPRGKAKSAQESKAQSGDCIDCKMCVGVCPTGVDIREGLSEGCITCGLCIDACDSIMDKTGKPRGLIRYLSDKEMHGEVLPTLWKRPRVITYALVFLLAASGIGWGLSHIEPVELTVVHERQPLFMRMSDGSIQNKYTIKAVNKTEGDRWYTLSVASANDAVTLVDGDAKVQLKAGKLIPWNVFLRAKPEQLQDENTVVVFVLHANEQGDERIEYTSMFVTPTRK